MTNAKSLSWAGVACLVLVLGGAYARQEHYPAGASVAPDDFPVYFVAASIARESRGKPLYFPDDQPYSTPMIAGARAEPGTAWDQTSRSIGLAPTLRFITPPFTAFLLAPLAHLPWRRAYLLWRLLTGVMVVLAVYFTLQLAPPQQHFWPVFAVAVAAALSFFPYLQTLWLGQMSALILLAWTLGVYFISRRRPIASALCFAVGTAVKVTPVLAVGLFLLRRQWRWLIAYGAWSALLLFGSVWRFGWQNHAVWLRMISPTLSCGVPYLENRSLPAFFLDLYYGRAFYHNLPASVPPLLCLLNKLLGGMVYLGILFAFWRKRKTSEALTHEVILMALVALVISPVSWRHHFVLALLPLFYLWLLMLNRRDGSVDAKLKVLMIATLILGVKSPEYALVKIPVLSIAVVGVWVAATAAVIWAGLQIYDGTIGPASTARGG